MPNKTSLILGVDTGGTFTDFVLYDGHSLRVHKVLSTPRAPEQAILQGVAELGLDAADFQRLSVVHGSTVATNAALEGKGVRTVYITNRGLGDVLSIGRQARAELYNLQPLGQPVPVPAERCLETGGRLGADGQVVEGLSEAELADLCAQVEALNPEAVAINLLFSFLDARFERAIEAALPEGLFVSRSSAILPEYKEYERGITTWLNAWVGPLVEGYLHRLSAGLPGARVAVMQSSGDTIAARLAGRQAVRMLLSGPAGGLVGARTLARHAGCEQVLTFDMGGTSTDVALIDGELALTTEGRIGPYPVSVPMVDMHTIGAGGGSIASVDAGGLLQVGPQSAGADPGPACYGKGGTQPTVTDANLVLGRLRADAFLGGGMPLDAAAARRALGRIAEPLGLSVEAAAEGVIRLANEHMSHALRVMSVQRGVDPRGLTLVSFGGAGGLHVCALAEALGMTQALVPMHAGVLSALGMLVAPRGRQLSRTLQGELGAMAVSQLEAEYAALLRQGQVALDAEGVSAEALRTQYSLDLRYLGQSYTLNIPWHGDREAAIEAFQHLHQERYGYRLARAVELVTLRLGLKAEGLSLDFPPQLGGEAAFAGLASLHGLGQEAEVWQRLKLQPGQRIEGPALVIEQVSTTFIAPGWVCMVDPVGNLSLRSEPVARALR